MNEHEKISYIEFPAIDIKSAKRFFTAVFAWDFVDYGPEYTVFSNKGINGGFFKSDLRSSTEKGRPLILFYSRVLEDTQSKINETNLNDPFHAGRGQSKASFPRVVLMSKQGDSHNIEVWLFLAIV